MEVSREILQAVSTGKVVIGSERSLKAIKTGQAKLIIASSNCARDVLSDVRHYSKLANLRVHLFDGDSRALGLACGKPFFVNMLAILDPGKSNVLSLEG